ncbi:hypothetical protein A2X44_02330 [candidate division CPR3 bacterium GWF2_35_18]|uniref:Uncharacterized protein n=1 Tax=candidate division CPR3 bacterium GW2011_GWF2_35_18 TaxID=1618350 RepID=A0A0G0BKJ7_UNCC3|nr:MAG: hypothetical protein UR67_C0002G0149 [candidate division CPR3 bacterium GW2011_GWF2_35_18]KKP86597.1 MAG: hypothetical protein UR87_C0015G0008 [candidate division CPR3 bacterium GW2011_GWE2_35_7]OGB62832.1 MAG: hypothetical protein A2X44_02330 [candidate division CPR3 bacterium GWF2_35_18]OGB65413.1 MAG: hypothetical protein A2250_00545 [candidate division CPR3 bacterium RIFOXYA2_FULL_35_13]OGB79525.1 MAG: hypothetical protein A2296_00330 [candidate division CPR3 bacterium RIFOXYB2_FULL
MNNDTEIRLKKIQGQINGILKMVEEKRDCLEITQQIAAIRNALSEVNLNLLEKESETCIVNNDQTKLLKFMKEILKRN